MTVSPVLREAVVDLGAIRANTARLREFTGTGHLIAVVKAAAYGHGAVPAARAALAGGADQLGVTEVAEALELRAAGIRSPVLSWQHGVGTDFAAALRAKVELGIGTRGQLAAVVAAARETGVTAAVHVKVDTGLSRNGLAPAEWDEGFAEVARAVAEGAVHLRGLWGHLANASEADDLAAGARLDAARQRASAAGLTPDLVHLAASAGALTRPTLRYDAVRIGIGLYGLQPEPYIDVAGLGLRPAMTLRATVAAVRRVPAGTGVSYGYSDWAPTETTLALVPVGYADGVPRTGSSAAPVVIGGAWHTVLGRVAMDQCVVDVGDTAVVEGDEAVLFGDPATGVPSADAFAGACGTIGYEIVTRIGARVPRTYVGGDADA